MNLQEREQYLEKFRVTDRIAKARDLIESLHVQEASLASLKDTLEAHKEAAQMREDVLAHLAMGKNEGERKAALAELKSKDVDWLALKTRVRATRGEMAQLEVDRDREHRHLRLIEAVLALRTAQIHFLSGA